MYIIHTNHVVLKLTLNWNNLGISIFQTKFINTSIMMGDGSSKIQILFKYKHFN